jgi:uncharacterized protein YbaR (Trm112 family)/SAM-dependent methyltransferase
MDVRLLNVLGCPLCRSRFCPAAHALECSECGQTYPLESGIPQLLPPLRETTIPTERGDSHRIPAPDGPWVKKAKAIVSVPSPTYETRRGRQQIPRFLQSFPPGSYLANVGSASLCYGKEVINVDLHAAQGVDVVGDATQLPFQDNSLDGIVSRRVLEHVRKPGLAVAEMRRVLKPGGRVWCEIPFLQGYHPIPADYQRYTQPGLADLFDRFEVIETGVALGPSSTLSWVLREYLSILFSFNNAYLYKIGERVFSWLTLPVKFTDYFLAHNRFAPQIASSFYIVARRPEGAGGDRNAMDTD